MKQQPELLPARAIGYVGAGIVVAIVLLVGYLQLSKRDAQPVTDEAERVWPRTPSPTA